jgi:hypothetical protein
MHDGNHEEQNHIRGYEVGMAIMKIGGGLRNLSQSELLSTKFAPCICRLDPKGQGSLKVHTDGRQTQTALLRSSNTYLSIPLTGFCYGYLIGIPQEIREQFQGSYG